MRINELGPPDRIIAGFAPELYGGPLNEGDVLEEAVVRRGGLDYYQWTIKPHRWGGACVGARACVGTRARASARARAHVSVCVCACARGVCVRMNARMNARL